MIDFCFNASFLHHILCQWTKNMNNSKINTTNFIWKSFHQVNLLSNTQSICKRNVYCCENNCKTYLQHFLRPLNSSQNSFQKSPATPNMHPCQLIRKKIIAHTRVDQIIRSAVINNQHHGIRGQDAPKRRCWFYVCWTHPTGPGPPCNAKARWPTHRYQQCMIRLFLAA